MTYKEFETYVNSLKNLKNDISFGTNSIKINYFSDLEKKSDYFFWIDPPWRITYKDNIIQNSYNNYPFHNNYSDDEEDLEAKDFKKWMNQSADILKNRKVKKIELTEIGDLSIHWEDGYTLNLFVNDTEDASFYFYDYVNFKSYRSFPFKIEVDGLEPRGFYILKREINETLDSKRYDIKKINELKDKVEKLNNKELNDLFATVYYNWGYDLDDLAEEKEGKEAEDLYKEVFDKYKIATKINPEYYEAFYNWANGLALLAQVKEGKEAESLYEQVFEKCQKAVDIRSDFHQAYYSWGFALCDLAKIKKGKEAESLYEQAFDKYQKIIEIKPDDYETFYSWGHYLGSLANTKEGKEAEILYEQAFDKFNKAIKVKPDIYEVFNNWGYYLGYLAKMKENTLNPKEADSLYNKAFDKLRKGIELGDDHYTLSCIYAIKGEKENALKYLNITLENKNITIKHIKKDKDWKDYLEDKDFIELLEKY